MWTGAAAGAGAALAGSPLLAQVGTVPPRPIAPLPAQPRVTLDTYIDQRILTRARAAFDRNRWRLAHTDIVGITDFSRASSEPRLYLVNTVSGRVSQHLVSHGRGSDPAHTGWLQRFSNDYGSYATSNGAYVTGDYYYGQYGRSMKLRGLEHSNSNAEARAIVVHSAWYAEPNVVREHGRLGRSEGCFAMSQTSLQEVLNRLGPGHLLYADKV
jgi:hypothetical protein